MLTSRAERELRDYLAMAVERHAAGEPSSEAIARGAALGVLSLWEGLVAELDARHDPTYLADRSRLSALIQPDAVSDDQP
ncbi:hypothetical protein DF037_28920 [Burkholderia contaminans]|uniref:Uncharacterized protein n=2 Tax=Burkholderia contaminans TaxID=488447 RepID=A0A3N8QEC6_9BURK|nr:hypothetical protein DF037_28920 [Burkholderia contaminans]